MSHERQFHDNELKSYSCPVCDTHFSTKYSLRYHLKVQIAFIGLFCHLHFLTSPLNSFELQADHDMDQSIRDVEKYVKSIRNTRAVTKKIVQKKLQPVRREELTCEICHTIAHGKWNMKRHMQVHISSLNRKNDRVGVNCSSWVEKKRQRRGEINYY